MLLDGIGLALVTAGTVFEGYDDWHDPLAKHTTANPETILFWFTGLNLGIFLFVIHLFFLQKTNVPN
jgi:hypothetical protein